MTVQEVLDQMDSWKDEERNQLGPLLNVLCGVSQQTLRQFQNEWDGSKPYDEFVVAQNAEIRKCVELEMSSVGATVRQELGLAPLTPDTVL